MFRTLHSKLTAILLLVLVPIAVLGITGFPGMAHTYFHQVTQQLNAELAANLLREKPLLAEDGQIDEAILADTFHWMMVVNPAIELYLLGEGGRILAFSAPPELVVRDRIDLQPVREFLDRSRPFPLYGDDPRSTGRKIFSAAGLQRTDGSEGFLYIVLSSQLHDSAAQAAQPSYTLRVSMAVLLGAVLIAFIAGTALFHLATGRLRRLQSAMADFEAADFSLPKGGQLSSWTSRNTDEIGKLGFRYMQMANRITHQMAAIRDNDQQRRDLIANVSHDLRTPLTALQTCLETLQMQRSDLSPVEHRAFLASAIDSSQRLMRRVDELFELARLESAHTPYELEEVSIGELLHDIVQEFRSQAQTATIELRAEVESNLSPVRCDLALMERLLQNLIQNALQNTPQGGQVIVRARADQRNLTIEVADTGCGIDPSILPLIFERYFSGNGAGSAGHGGLGLAICKRIAELHAGVISARNRMPSGAVFTCEMPLSGPSAA